MERMYFDVKNVGYEATPGTYTLTDNNLTVQINKSSNIRTNAGIMQGKIYWEIRVISNSGMGFCGVLGAHGDLFLRFYADGEYTLNYTQVVSRLEQAVYTENDVVGIALDVERRSVGIYINGKFKGNIALITNDKMFHPAIGNSSSSDSIGIKATANFGETPFAYPIPDGYTSFVKRHRVLYLKENEIYGIQP